MNNKRHYFKDVAYNQYDYNEEPYGVQFKYKEIDTDEWKEMGFTFSKDPERQHPVEIEWRKWSSEGGVTALSEVQMRPTLDQFFG